MKKSLAPQSTAQIILPAQTLTTVMATTATEDDSGN